jgi:hypothetical protein
MKTFLAVLVLCLISTVAIAGEKSEAEKLGKDVEAAVAAAQDEAVAAAEEVCTKKSCVSPRKAVKGVAKSAKSVGCYSVKSTARVVRGVGKVSKRSLKRVRTRVRGKARCNCK